MLLHTAANWVVDRIARTRAACSLHACDMHACCASAAPSGFTWPRRYVRGRGVWSAVVYAWSNGVQPRQCVLDSLRDCNRISLVVLICSGSVNLRSALRAAHTICTIAVHLVQVLKNNHHLVLCTPPSASANFFCRLEICLEFLDCLPTLLPTTHSCIVRRWPYPCFFFMLR